MTSVVAIEFCADFFKTESMCYDWLRNSQWSDLLRVKGFSLRRNGQALLLTTERKRSVYRWSQGLGSYSSLNIDRPISTVCLALASGVRFTPTDLPTPLPATIERERLKKERHAARVAQLRAKREEEQKNKPPKERKRKKSTKGKKPKKEKITPVEVGIKLEEESVDGHDGH